MKKSLLLSIVMTLVLVVAMSTATFAWYTANAKVTASATEITAGTSGSSLVITAEDNATVDSTQNSVALTLTGTIDPMVLAEDYEVGDAYAEVLFKNAEEDNAGNLVSVKNATPATIEQVDGAAHTSFFVTNTGNAATGAIKLTIAPVAENQELNGRLCVAVFANGELVGIYAAGDCHYATAGFLASDAVNTYPSADAVDDSSIATAVAEFTVVNSLAAFGNAGDAVEISFKAWLDGDTMVNSNAGQSAQFSISIAA